MANDYGKRPAGIDGRDFIRPGLGVAEPQHVALQAAYDACHAEHRPLILPDFSFYIGATVNVRAPTYGYGGSKGGQYTASAGIPGSQIRNSGITTGLMLNIDTTIADPWVGGHALFEGFTVNGYDYLNAAFRPGVTAMGCTTDGPNGNFWTRSVFRDMRWIYTGIGLDFHGFIMLLDNCYTYGTSNVGVLARLANAVTVVGGEYVPASQDPDVPDGGWAMRFISGKNESNGDAAGSGVWLYGPCIESNGSCNGLDISEAFTNVHIEAYFEGFEGDSTTECFSMRIGGINRTGGAPTNAMQDAVHSVHVIGTNSSGLTEQYDGIGAHVYYGNILNLRQTNFHMYARRITYSQWCRSVDGSPHGRAGAGAVGYENSWHEVDDSGRLYRPIKNCIINPNFRGGIRGFERAVQYGNFTLVAAPETTITRDGISSLRVTHPAGDAGQTNRFVLIPFGLDITNTWFTPEWAANPGGPARWVAVCGWVYIPNIGYYQTRDAYPALGISWKADGVLQAPRHYMSTGNQRTSFTPGRWHRFRCFQELTGTAPYTEIGLLIQPYANNGGTFLVPAVDHYVCIADAALAINPSNLQDFFAGKYTTEERCGRMFGEIVEVQRNLPPTTTSVQWKVGDRCLVSTPTPGGPIGHVCVADSTIGVNAGTWLGYGEIY